MKTETTNEAAAVKYRGIVTNKITAQVWRTRYCTTWERAHHAAERLGRRVTIWANAAISVIVS